jgi:pimeloyl-CoA synthetase
MSKPDYQVQLENIKEALAKSKNGMFSDRETPNEAFEYAQQLAAAEGMTPSVMATAIMVYHNTLLHALEELLED